MKNLLNPTKQKILLSLVVVILYYIVYNLFIAVPVTSFCLPRLIDKPLPFMLPNSTLVSEWQKARAFDVCGSSTQLQEIFRSIKLFAKVLLEFVVPSYLIACTIIVFITKREQKKLS
jgi:hypothetical protein